MIQQSKFGLPESVIESLKLTFSKVPQIEKVIVYGSRAKGNFRIGSDIDICLFGNALTTTDLLALENKIEDLMLPYKLDLSAFHYIESEQLKDHINRVGKNLY